MLLRSTTTAGGTATAAADSFQVKNQASRWGVKGSHDLGGGMTAKYHIEYGVNPDGDSTLDETKSGVDLNNDGDTKDKFKSSGLTRRNQWAGIAAGWGEVRIGRHDTPLKMSQGKFDQFNNRTGDIRFISGGENRLDNVIAYVGKFGAITVAAAIVPGEGDGKKTSDVPAGSGTGDGPADTTSVAVMYKAGPLYAALAMDAYDSTDGEETDTLTRATATYKMGKMQAGFMYETGGFGTKDDEYDLMGVSFAMGVGKNAVKAQYLTREDSATVSTEMTSMSVGYDINLSKQVTPYVMYTVNETTTGTTTREITHLAAGLIVKF